MDLFGGLVAITVLLWNLGYEKTLSFLGDELNLRISDKLSSKYQQNDNKVEKKRNIIMKTNTK